MLALVEGLRWLAMVRSRAAVNVSQVGSSIDDENRPCRFRLMRAPLPRRGVRIFEGILAVAVLLSATSCERGTPTPGQKDTAVHVVPPPESTVVAVPSASTWDSSAGPALFIAGETPSDAAVIAPDVIAARLDTTHLDVAGLRVITVDLFAAGKRIGTARVVGTASSVQTDSCRTWPTARLVPVSDSTATPLPWTVGFQSGHAADVPIDSIEGLATVDSAKLAADIARLASALPGDTAAAFRGLPFVVTKAWRARSPSIGDVLAAIVVRNVNQEANPLQERLLIVAERDTSAAATRYSPAYTERISGLEETLETTDLIAMVRLGDARRLSLIVARDSGNGSSYALIERLDGHWRQRWVSAYGGC